MALVRRGENWYAVLSIDGKQKWVACGKNRAKAKAIHDEFVVQQRRGELSFPTQVTFAAFAQMWFDDYASLTLKPVTLYDYEIALRVYLIPAFGRMKLTAIKPADVQAYVSGLVREGRLSAKSIRNQVVPLRRMFNVAIQWGYANSNPAEKLALPRLERRELPFLTPPQMRLLIENTEPPWRALIALGCMCGLRRGECLGLTWNCIDWSEHRLDIRRSLWGGKLQEPKTKKSATKLPMPATVEDLLFERMTISPASEMDLVFCREDGSPLRPDWVNRGVLLPALERANLHRLTFHSLRHSFVAALIGENLPLKVVQEMSRHASVQTTLDTYGHLQPEAKANAARALEEAIWGRSG